MTLPISYFRFYFPEYVLKTRLPPNCATGFFDRLRRPLLRSPFSSAPIRAAFLSPCTVRHDTLGHVTECGALAFLQSLCYTDKQEVIPLCGIYFSWKGYHILWM